MLKNKEISHSKLKSFRENNFYCDSILLSFLLDDIVNNLKFIFISLCDLRCKKKSKFFSANSLISDTISLQSINNFLS